MYVVATFVIKGKEGIGMEIAREEANVMDEKISKRQNDQEEAKADKTSHQLGQSLVHRVKVMESRVKTMMEKPLPPGFNTLGLAFNLFTGEPGEKMVDVATDSVHKSDGTLLYQKYKCPAGVYGDVISDEEESRTVQVFQDETSFAYTLASEMKDGKILKGALALAPDIESVRPIFAGNSYLARIRKSINQFRIGIAAGASTENGLRQDLVPGKPGKAEFGSDKSLARKMDDDDSSLPIKAPGQENKAYTINEDFLHNVCDLKGVGRGGVDWLPDCVFSPKSIILDKDFQDENSQNIFRSRNKHESANAEKDSDEVRICSATDTVKVSNFIKYYGTDYIQEVTLGGEAIQTFEIRGAAVDSENTQPEAIISTIINKYEEHFEGKDKAVDGHYNLKDPMLASAVDGYMNKKIQKIFESCDGDMFNDGKDSLAEAEGKCGGSIYQLLIGKKKDMEATGGTNKNAFLQLFSRMRSKNYLGTPVTDMLSGSAGTGKEGASKKALEEKIRSQAAKDGKQQLDCGIARIIPSKLKEIKDRVECIKVKTGGNLQGSLSKGKMRKNCQICREESFYGH